MTSEKIKLTKKKRIFIFGKYFLYQGGYNAYNHGGNRPIIKIAKPANDPSCF